MFRGIKAFFRKYQGLVQNLDQLQKLEVFHESSEVKLKTG